MAEHKTPTQRLAEAELPLASDDAHSAFYDLLVEAASERVLPAVDERHDEGREEAA